MAALQPPKTLITFIDKHKNDCSQQGICSLHCPQLCLKAIFPNPPSTPSPPSPNLDQFSTPTTSFSPVVIAVICILAGALLLLSYYTLISKYCGRHGTTEDEATPTRNRGRRRQRRQNNLIIHHDHTGGGDEFDAAAGGDVMNSSLHEPWQWHVSLTTGLDEAQIKSITVCKYRKEDGLLAAGGGGGEGTEHHCCSVCLSEFRDGESLRLLPKCSHAFHLDCIDTWLRTHSTCPLCRANIFFFGTETAAAAADDGTERVELVVEGAEQSGNENYNGGEHEERDDRRQALEQVIRRCVSMDHMCLRMGNNGYDCGVLREEEEEGKKHDDSSQSSTNNSSSSSSSRRMVDTVKRSFSSGRLFYLTRHGNRACTVHPDTFTSNSTSNV